MSEERLHQVILGPVISEKANLLGDKRNQIVLKVSKTATKEEIAAAVLLLFGVKPLSVNTMLLKGKKKRSGRFFGLRQDRKKAYVSLPPGQDINFSMGE